MRWIFRLAFALVGLVIAGVVILFLLPAERIASIAEERFEAATGRAMTLSGGVSPTVWPVFGVSTGPVSIANADWSDEGPLLTAEALQIGVDAAALIRGEIRIRNVEATAPSIILERNSDGEGNWQIGAADPDVAAEAAPETSAADDGTVGEDVPRSGPRFFSLDVARITDGAILYIDRRDGSRSALSDIDAVAELPDFNGLATLDFAGTMNGQRIDTTSRIEGLSTFLANGAVPVAVSGQLGSADISFNGRAGLAPLAAAGRIESDLGDLTGPFAVLGLARPELPGGMGDDMELSGDITFTDQTLNIRGAAMRLGPNRLTGAADIALKGQPKITAQIETGDLDLSAFSPAASGEGPGGTSGSETSATGDGDGVPDAGGWPTTPIDVSALNAIDLDLSLSASSIDLGALQFGAARTVTQLQDGRAVTEISQLQGYGGSLSGTFVVNGRSGLSVRANLAGRGIVMEDLLLALADLDRLSGTGDVSVNLLGVGNSLDAIMRSLEGDASVRLSDGEMRGIDLARVLRNLDPSAVGPDQRTPLEAASASFAVAGGTARTENLTIDTPAVTATGRGSIGIGARTLDLRVIPSLVDGQDINVPVVISGPWSGPRVTLDLAAAAQEEIQEELDQLRGQAEQALQDRIGQELGIERQDGETTEQLLQRGLEERATEGLNNLLGDILNGGN